LRKFSSVIGWIALLSACVVTFGFVLVFHPDLVYSSLDAEKSATGLVVGLTNTNQMKEYHGQPTRTVQEQLTTKYEYNSTGVLYRLDRTTGVLNWVEFTGSTYHTGKGIRVGDSFDAVLQAYGKPANQIDIGERTLLRYSFGVKYSLEFWMSATAHVEKVVFYSS
jgi:hypothetical protein